MSSIISINHLYFLGIHLFLGFEEITRMLIEKGANVNAVNEDNNSALVLAIVEGNVSFRALHKIYIRFDGVK